jgi:Carboxypeptidase regulatory-like domain
LGQEVGVRRVLITSSIFVTLIITHFARAQEYRATIVGTVVDQAGAVITSASVTLTNEASNISASTKTSEDGIFQFAYVQPGSYTMTVVQSGFSKLVRRGLVVQVGQRVDVELKGQQRREKG